MTELEQLRQVVQNNFFKRYYLCINRVNEKEIAKFMKQALRTADASEEGGGVKYNL